eukprot:m.465851 g.465851  ORF g.465851 m.465851 type:complete len:220 (-) comp24628_c0_seq1:227-886(-)
MRPDAHKKTRARQYQKSNPEAAAVAASRRKQRGNTDDKAGGADGGIGNRSGIRDAARHNQPRDLPQNDDSDSTDDAEDLDKLLVALDSTDGSATHFRFRAEGALDPVELLASASFVGTTDSRADTGGNKSVLWPSLTTLAANLSEVPVHQKLGLQQQELVSRAMAGTADDTRGVTLEWDLGTDIAPDAGSAVVLEAEAAEVVQDGNESDNLEDWLDSVL